MTTFYLPEDWDAVLESRTPGVTTIEKTPPVKYQGRAPVASGDDLLMFNTQNLTMEAQRANQLNEKLLRPPLETSSIQRPDGPQSTLTDEDRAIVAPEVPPVARLPSPAFDITNQAGRFAQPKLRSADAPRRSGGAAPLTIDPHRAKAMAESAVGAVKSFGTNLRDDVLRLANRQPGTEFTGEDAGAALRSGPGMLLPVFGRAPGLGALGGQKMRPTKFPEWPHSDKAMQVAQTMAQEGVGPTQIADTLTRYYTPPGVSVSVYQVKKLLDAQGLTKADLPTANAFRARAPGITDEVRQGIFSIVRESKDVPIAALIEKVRRQYPSLPATDERLTSLLTRAKRVADAEAGGGKTLRSGGLPTAAWDVVLEPASP